MSMSADQISATPVLLREDCDGIVTLTLNRPKQSNALSADLLTALQSAFDDIAATAADDSSMSESTSLNEKRANFGVGIRLNSVLP